MTRAAPWLLLSLLVALSAVVALELQPRGGDEDSMTEPPARVATLPAAPTPPAANNHTQEWVETILARPLFAPNRRPPANAPAAPAAAAPPLPRVTGILIDGNSRNVIFANPGGRPVVVPEGGSMNGFRVQSIETGQVILSGPDGPRTLRPSFDPQPASPSSPPPPGLPGLQGLTGIPGLPMLGAPPNPPSGPSAR